MFSVIKQLADETRVSEKVFDKINVKTTCCVNQKYRFPLKSFPKERKEIKIEIQKQIC